MEFIISKRLMKYINSFINNEGSPLPPWKEHVRLWPEMYIGNPTDGTLPEDGIYRMIREVLDVALNESDKGSNLLIDLSIDGQIVSIRDYGLAIPMDQLAEYVSERRRDAIGADKTNNDDILHYGIGLKVVNLLSASFTAQSFEDWKSKTVEFAQGRLIRESNEEESFQPSGNLICFIPDVAIFGDFHFIRENIVQMLWRYVFQNTGLEIRFGGQRFQA